MFKAVVFITTQTWKQPKMSIKWRKDKYVAVHPPWTTLGDKEGVLDKQDNVSGSRMSRAGGQEPDSKGCVQCGFINTALGKVNLTCRDQEQTGRRPKLGMEGRMARGRRKLRGAETFCVLIAVAVSWDDISVKTHQNGPL